jgi:polar amino acid transport system substrate-binding protein
MSAPVEIPAEIVARVRTLCLALPEATVRVDYPLTRDRSTAHSFEIRRRSFCLLVAREGSAGQPVPLLVLRAGPEERDALLAGGPPFFASRAGRDRVLVMLTGNTDWQEIRELVTESYRILAPKKLTALLDQGEGSLSGAATVAGMGGDREPVVRDLVPRGVLRAAINLGNPVLAQRTAEAPAGVTVDIARELGARLGVAVDLACFAAARDSLAAMTRGDADICFLAIEPARAAEVAFTAPYVVIEGVFVVPADSALTAVSDVDRAGLRIGVNEGSAYDLFLSRTLRQASVVRGPDGISLFREQGLDAGAGIGQVVRGFTASHPGFRVIDEPFMQIRQALGTSRSRAPGTVAYLAAVIEDLKASGFIGAALRRSGHDSALVAPPQPPA